MGRSRGGLTTKIPAVVNSNGNPIALKLSEGQAHDGRSAWANIKPMLSRVNIPAFSPWLYRYRNLVERFFNKLKHFRAVATRFEKHDANYLALVKLAAARTWMLFIESVT